MTTRFALTLLLLAAPALPQGGEDPTAQAVAKQGDAEQLFYRAFYLNRGERRYDEALALYQSFLEAAPDNRFAARAANDAAAILSRAGKAEEAQKLRDRYASAKPAAVAAPPAATDTETPATESNQGQREGGDAPAAEQRAMTDAEKASLTEQVAGWKAELQQAEEAGEERTVQRLGRQIQRAERQLESGMVPAGDAAGRGQRGQGRGNRRQVDFAQLDEDQIAQRLEQMERFQSQALARLRESGQADQADKIEKQWTEMKKLLDEGKKAEAQKIYDEVMSSMRRRRQ